MEQAVKFVWAWVDSKPVSVVQEQKLGPVLAKGLESSPSYSGHRWSPNLLAVPLLVEGLPLEGELVAG
jgi:hypothetical protein